MKNENSVEHLWTIPCSYSSIDAETNNISLFNVIEEVGFQLQPINSQPVSFSEKKNIPFPIDIISLWKRSSLNAEIHADVKIELFDAENQKMQEVIFPLEFKQQHQRMRLRIHLNGITVTGQGEYFFSIKLKEKNWDDFREVSKVPLVVKIASPLDLKSLA